MNQSKLKKFLIIAIFSLGMLIIAGFILILLVLKNKNGQCESSTVRIKVDGKIINIDYDREIKVLFSKDSRFYINIYDQCGIQKEKIIEVSGE